MTVADEYDPLSKDVKQDQHRWFARLRGECPVHHHTMPESELKRQSENYIVASPTAEFWSVFGYKDVQQILHDAGGFSHLEGPGPDRMAQLSPDGMLLTADDPAHRRQRRIASKAFLPRTVARRVPVIQRTVDELIDGFADRGRCDLMRDFAFPLTVTMLIDFMGVGQDRKDDITRWGAAAIAILGGDEEQLAAGTQATIEFFAFMQECIDDRRAVLAAGEDAGDDVLTAMITAYDEETDTRFSDVEILQAMHQFYTAGYETTATAIGNGVYRLCTNPGEREKLQADWSLIDTACEEILRYDSPVEGTFRTTTCPQLISGVEIPAGAKTRIVFASANRDGVAFDRPDEFRVDRPIKELRGHLAFGAGPHTCLGSALGRAEIKYAIQGLLTRLPDLDLDPSAPPTRSSALTVCGFTDIPIVWNPANAAPRLG